MAISRATPMATYWVHLRFSLDFLLRYHTLDALFHLSPGGQHLVAASGTPQADVHPHPQHLPPAAAAGVFLFQLDHIVELQVHGIARLSGQFS